MKPPFVARLIVRLTTGDDDRDFAEADLARRFDSIREAHGAGAARRWYWSQAVRGLVWRVRSDLTLRTGPGIEGVAGDLRHGARALLRRPVYTFGVIGTLALGLGSAALVSTVAWTVWLSPMPFPDPDRVVRLYETAPPEEGSAAEDAASGRRWRVSPPLLEDFRAHSFETIEAVSGVSLDDFDWELEGELRRITSLKVSADAFGILGVTPIHGRLPSDEGAPEVLLTHDFWTSTFGADPGAIGGQTLVLDGIAREVVGVVEMPAGYPRSSDIVTLLRFQESQLSEGMRGARYLDVVARVRPGRTVAEAEAEAEAFMAALGAEHPQHDGWSADLAVLGDNLVASYRGVLGLLLAAGLTFLLLSVVNVGGLVAARRAEALAERSVRLALGASEARLLRGSIVESILLGAAGAGSALLLARWLATPLQALLPGDIPRLTTIELGWAISSGVVVIGLGIGGAVGVLGYLMSRTGTPTLRNARGTTVPGLRGRRWLVAGQVALTTLLTTGGVAILRYVSELRSIDLGFEAERVLTSPVVLSEVRYPDEASRLAVWTGIEESLAARGITAAVAVNTPMAGSNMPYGFRTEANADEEFAQYHSVSSAYFDVLGIEILEGRAFGPGDVVGSQPVIIVSAALRDAYFPGENIVGREIRLLNRPMTVVGVVASTAHFGPDAERPLELYVPLAHDPWQLGTILMRTDRSDAADVLAATTREVAPSLGVPPPHAYTQYVAEWYAPLRLQLVLVGGLALLGLTLASLGLYALIAYHVSTRRREIGIRIALGAPNEQVFRSVVRQGMALAGIGGAAGLALWYALASRTSGLIDGLDVTDPLVPLLVAVVVGSASVLATLAPAWRSTSVDPVTTLKAE